MAAARTRSTPARASRPGRGLPSAGTGYLLATLGRLPDDRKRAFVAAACARLAELAALSKRAPPALSDADAAALRRVAEHAERFAHALDILTARTGADRLMREAWTTLEHIRGFPVVDVAETVHRLRDAALLLLPDPRPAHKTVKRAPVASLAVALLAADYRHHFGDSPTFGTGSPFVKFTRAALDAHGLPIPSLAEIKRAAG